jgi:glycosyltransferase involved in cell wall biosynthesis
MRIVFVTHAYSPSRGGAQTYARGLAEALSRRGHHVTALAPDVTDPEAFYELGHHAVGVEVEAIDGVTVRRVPLLSRRYRWGRLLGSRSGLKSSLARYRRGLHRALADLQPDVVFTLPHLFPNVTATLALRSTADWRLAYAPMLHEHDPNWSIPRVSEASAGADAIVALTTHERDRLVAAYRSPPERTAVVAPGVGLPLGAPPAVRCDEILILGRRAASKRLDVAMAAMAIVWRTHPDTRLIVAGAPSFREPAFDPNRVTVVDGPDDAHRERLLFQARAVVSASLTEAFGLHLLEAWAHGTPVVAVDTPVSREIVRPGVDGLLTAADPEGLAAGILEILGDPQRAERMGAAGRDRVAAEFTWDAAAESFDRMIARW